MISRLERLPPEDEVVWAPRPITMSKCECSGLAGNSARLGGADLRRGPRVETVGRDHPALEAGPAPRGLRSQVDHRVPTQV
jgi:hypothetical protein